MTYTDTDIAKALKCCADKKRCHDCPFCVTSREPCYITLSREASSLLARRDAEIERLKGEMVRISARTLKVFEKKIKDVQFTLGQTWEIQCALEAVLKDMEDKRNV